MRSWHIYPHSNGNFTDSYSDYSKFFSTVRAQHLADQVLAHLPLFQMAISQIPALLWELIIGRWGLGRSTPISNGSLTDSCSDCSYFFPTLRAQHLADQVLADLPLFKWHFHRFLFYSESSTFGRPGLGISTPLQMAISQIPVLLLEFIFGRPTVGKSTPFKWQFNRFLLWLLIFLSYSESSTFGRPSVGRSIPLSNSYFTDSCSDWSYFFPTLRAHI